MERIFSLITAFGLGSLATVLLQSFLQRWREVSQKQHEFKFTRYKCIVLLMQARVHWDDDTKSKLRIHRPDLQDLQDLDKELRTEVSNALLFASKEVIKALSKFSKNPAQEEFVEATSAMRKDLWGRRERIDKGILLGAPLTSEVNRG